MLYAGGPSAEADGAAAAAVRAGADATFEESRLMEAVWDIETAVFERQWYDAVSMIEAVRAENRDALGGSGAATAAESETDRFAVARADLCAVVDHLSSELLAFTCDPTSVRSVREYAPLLARLGMQEEARHAVLSAGATVLVAALDAMRRRYGRGVPGEVAFVATVGARLFAQLCESYAALAEVCATDAACNDAAFLTWAIGQVDATYERYLAPVLDAGVASVYEMAALVTSLRNSTLRVPMGDMFEEIGMVLDSRLSAMMRDEVCASLVQYQEAFANRAEAAGSAAVEQWEGVPLRSSVALCDEFEKFARDVALNLLGIDNGVDALIASVLTVASGIYAANILHAKNSAAASTPDQRRSLHLSRAAHMTLEAVSAALTSAASVDHILRANSGILWMAAQLRSGALCGPDGLRQMGLAAVPPRPRAGTPTRARAPAPAARTRARAPARAALDEARARELARDVLQRERRFAAA